MKYLSKSILKRGFTLIEMVVTLSIIAILAVVITTQFGGDSAKATKLLSDMTVIKKGMLRYQLDNGKYPENFYNMTQSTDVWSFSDRATWNGPYIDRKENFADISMIKVDGIDGAGMDIEIDPMGFEGSSVPGYSRVVYLRAFNLPESIIIEALKKCNATAGVVNFSNSNCAGGSGVFSYYVGPLR